MLSLYEILKASKTGIATDMWTALAGMNWGGKDSGAEVKELTGIPPLSFTADGTPLLDYLISGNMSQSGTPTPTTPIQPQECGERTGNLWDGNYENGVLNTDGTLNSPNFNYSTTTYILTEKENYTLSVVCNYDLGPRLLRICFYDENKNFISCIDSPQFRGVSFFYEFNFTAPSNSKYLRFSYIVRSGVSDTNIMLNTGSTALPYEPYGYKIPISSGGENLFDYPQDNYSTTINSVVWTIENGVIKGEGFTTSQGRQDCILVRKNGLYWSGNYPNYYFLNASTDMKLPAGTYTFSYIPITEPTTISLRPRLIIGHEGGRYIDGTAKFVWNGDTFTVDSDDYVALALNTSNSIGEYEFGKFMLNRGSTALPYEPYNRTTTPIYLGEVPTTRRIRKLVLTGEESWDTHNSTYYITVSDYYRMYDIGSHLSVCSHYPDIQVMTLPEMHYCLGGLVDGSTHTAWNGNIVFNPSPMISSLTDWKAYLAQQYAAGTPVTIWYVLAEPETGIVNEPLMRIGDYADTLSMEQAGVSIPTNNGSTTVDVETTLKPSQMYIKYQE